MIWTEVKKWAISHGYKVDRQKIDGKLNKYNYFWEEQSNRNNKGHADSVFNLARELYNNMTSDIYITHQEKYFLEPKDHYYDV